MPRRTIFYDGLCRLCSTEIAHFRRRVRDGSLAYVDIAAADFDPAAHGLDAARVQKEMHVRDDDTGRVLVGVPALAAMWECVPGFRWLATLTRTPGLRRLAGLGYAVFAWVRPKLPRKRCADERCRV